MDKTLLIGNGLNRTLKSSISWEDLLDDIANEYGVEHIDKMLIGRGGGGRPGGAGGDGEGDGPDCDPDGASQANRFSAGL